MTGSSPNPDDVRGAVRARYAALSSGCCSLSCGSALDRAALAPGETVVDLGCGRGQDVVRAAGRVGPGGLAIGVDLSAEMLERARQAIPPALGNVRLVRSDLAPLDLPDEAADVVVSNCTINHAPDKAAVFREVWRVLRRGGRFVVADVVSEGELPDHVRNDPAAWAACYGGAIPEARYLAAARDAGFAGLEVVERSAPYDKGGVQVRSLALRGRKP